MSSCARSWASKDGDHPFLLQKKRIKRKTLEDKNGLAGLEAVWGLEKQEQRFLYAEDPYTVKTGEKAWNMGRLTNIEAFLGSFHLKEAGRISFIVDAVDPLLEENNGTFLWTLDETGADVKKLTSTEELPDAALHAQRFSARAGELVSWLTGYRDAAQIWPERSQELTEAMAAVDVVNGVFGRNRIAIVKHKREGVYSNG